MIQRFEQKNIGRAWYLCILALLVLARLAIPLAQRVFLIPEGSALDDSLMLSAAQSMAEGQWLGPYTGVSMAKSMGYALWLALVHKTGLPYLLANAGLWLAVCAFAARALRPLARGNLPRLCLFAFFAFWPASFAGFTLRVYRDAIFPAFCLLLFAGVLGLALRCTEKAPAGRWLSAGGAAMGLTGVFLLREDGLVLLPFALCGLLLVALFALFGLGVQGKLALLLQCLLPFAALGAGVLAFSAANYAYQGVFLPNDLTGGSFPKAYGAMVAVSEAESGYQKGAPVSDEALAKLLEEVPSLGALAPSLETGAARSGFYNQDLDAFGGSFYYAVRLAAWYEGLTPTAPAAQEYWAQVHREIEAAVAEGRLQSLAPRTSTIPRWNAQLLSPLLQESASALRTTLLFEQNNHRPVLSVGDAEKIAQQAAWLHSKTTIESYLPGTDIVTYGGFQKLVFFFCDVLVWVYRVLIWPLLACALFGMGRSLGRGLRRLFAKQGYSPRLLLGLLALGLLLSYLLRMGVASYMEVAAFGVGTYLMYLAGGLPALMLLCTFGALLHPPLPGEVAEDA